MRSMSPVRVAVIGAGVSGLTAARHLADHGIHVKVFEKARGPGGRISSRRQDGYIFDHGAPFFTAASPSFAAAVEGWQQSGWIHPWPVLWSGSNPMETGWVGVPRMSALARCLSRDLEAMYGVRVAAPRWRHNVWLLKDDNGESLGEYDGVMVCTPAPQAEALLASDAPALAAIAAEASYKPCWVAMAGFEEPLAFANDALRFVDSPLEMATYNGGKPGREGDFGWVIHASTEWTLEHLDTPAYEVARELVRLFSESLDISLPKINSLNAHRWLYSQVDKSIDEDHLYLPERRIAVCGDWCGNGPGLEVAVASGRSAAVRFLQDIASS